MSAITLSFHDHSVRTITQGGEVLFVASDVCRVLGLKNVGDALEKVDGDDIVKSDVTDSSGRKQLTKLVTESGLYTLLVRSNKPQAKEFQRWVTKEVLPTIRKTGKYEAPAPAAPEPVPTPPAPLVLEAPCVPVNEVDLRRALAALVAGSGGHDVWCDRQVLVDAAAVNGVKWASGLEWSVLGKMLSAMSGDEHMDREGRRWRVERVEQSHKARYVIRLLCGSRRERAGALLLETMEDVRAGRVPVPAGNVVKELAEQFERIEK